MKVGVLYPRSKVYANISSDFTNGLKSYLKKEQLEESVQLFLETVGYGGSEKEVYEKAEKLLILDEVDLIVAYIDEKVIGLLQPLIQSSGKLVLMVNSGANYPESWMISPGIIRLTLQDAFLCNLAGQLAGKEKDKTAIVASTFYDCGYLHLATMVSAFTNSGGQVIFNYINRQQGEPFHINELAAFLEPADKTGTLLTVFGTETAILLYEHLNALKDAGRLHLFVSPMMLEPAALATAGNGFNFSVDGFLPWMSALDNSANREFSTAYETQTKKETNLFSLLGWESGMVLGEIFLKCKDRYADASAITTALSSATINSPRGTLKLDPATNNFTAPYIKCSIQKNSSPVLEPVAFSSAAWEEYIKLPTAGAHSGWTNTYLCY